jgi:hypothetical protein
LSQRLDPFLAYPNPATPRDIEKDLIFQGRILLNKPFLERERFAIVLARVTDKESGHGSPRAVDE